MSKTLAEVRADMNARYASGAAYSDVLPYNRLMTPEIYDAVLRLGDEESLPRSLLDVAPVLDVGCGWEGIAKFWPHRQIVGIELSEAAVAEARRRHPDVTYVAVAVEDFDECCTPHFGRFRLAVAVESIEHWVDVDRGLAAVARALAPGGHFILTTPNRDSLHCRMARKFGYEAPTVSSDHIHEFGFQELIARVQAHGFWHQSAAGAHLAPYWALEQTLGPQARRLTDRDEEVIGWLNDIGRRMPPEYAMVQAHRFQKVGP